MSINNFLFLEFSFGKSLYDKGHLLSTDSLNIKYDLGDNLPCNIFRTESLLLIAVGHPSYSQSINNDLFFKKYLELRSNEASLASIDGEFLIVECDLKSGNIKVVNSRFGTPIAFYASFTNRFVISTSYKVLYDFLIQNKLAKLNPEVCYDLLRFRRVFCNDTYDTCSKYLSPATVLKWNGKLLLNRYWTPSYSKNSLSLNDNSYNLVDLIRGSISYKTSDNRKYGIMQSGGLDTRLILSNFVYPPHAFTITYTKNREYDVAKQLVDFKQGEHSWIQVKDDQYSSNFDTASSVTGGMYMADCLFYGHKDIIRKKSDVLFAGFGMDYFFQGMYLPSKMYSIFGEPIPWFKTLGKFKGDFVDYFINNISYYTKGVDIKNILSNKQLIKMNDRVFHAISTQLTNAKEYTDNPYDIWEHMSLGDLSRHYTYGGQLALMESAELRNISYTNAILDLYHSLPSEQRFDARILRRALKISDKRFYNLQSANHGYPAGYSSLQRSVSHIWKHLPERIGIREKKRKFERTWLEGDAVLRTDLRKKIINLKKSDVLADLDIVDMTKMRSMIDLWSDGKIKGGQTFTVLLTLESFFSSGAK
jgi:asparagine synthetase B (glutamine-hydrolysing)